LPNITSWRTTTMKRRSFLKVAGGVAGSCALGPGSLPVFAGAAGDKQTELPRRVLGRTGAKISIVAFPGLAL